MRKGQGPPLQLGGYRKSKELTFSNAENFCFPFHLSLPMLQILNQLYSSVLKSSMCLRDAECHLSAGASFMGQCFLGWIPSCPDQWHPQEPGEASPGCWRGSSCLEQIPNKCLAGSPAENSVKPQESTSSLPCLFPPNSFTDIFSGLLFICKQYIWSHIFICPSVIDCPLSPLGL